MIEFAVACWLIACELSPWLLLGMALSGLLHRFVPAGWIRRRFRGYGGVVRAVLLGVPLPLCSCGVIPAGISMKKNGASDGSAIAFLISTPQTGVDSILVTSTFFGWPFALIKVLAALVTGLLGGWLVELTGPRLPRSEEDAGTGEEPERNPASQLPLVLASTATASGAKPNGKVFDGLSANRLAIGHAIGILRSIWLWLLIGIAVSAALQLWLPPEWIGSLRGLGLLPTMLGVLLFSLPLYVCATASIPVAAGLVASGLPLAAGFVFLFAGPATNVATVGAVAGQFGRRIFLIYLGTLVTGGLAGGWLISLGGMVMPASIEHLHAHLAWWNQAAAVVVSGLVLRFLWERLTDWKRRRSLVCESAAGATAWQLNISGMHCGNCVDRLQRALSAVPGMRTVSVDLASERAILAGSFASAAVVDAVREAGFEPVGMPQQVAPSGTGPAGEGNTTR